MKKRLLSLTLIAALCLSLFPTGAAPALAVDGDTVYVGGVALTGSEENPAYASLTMNGGSLTTSENLEIDLNTSNPNNSITSKPTASDSDEIVFDGDKGTVYGNVILQENLTIESGQTLTIGQDASLTVPQGVILTNIGTVIIDGGTLTNNGTIHNYGILPDNIAVEGDVYHIPTYDPREVVLNSPPYSAVCDIYYGDETVLPENGKFIVYGTKNTDFNPLTLSKEGDPSQTISLVFRSFHYGVLMPWGPDDQTNVIAVIEKRDGVFSEFYALAVGCFESDMRKALSGTYTGTMKIYVDYTTDAANVGDEEKNVDLTKLSAYEIEVTLENTLGLGITTQPRDVIIDEGSAAIFSVTASGDIQSYQWQVSDDRGTTWKDIPDATEATYTVTDTTPAMSGYQYHCVVKDIYGNSVISNAVSLTVNAVTVPVTGVSLNKSETTLTVGGTAQLTATVTPTNATNQNVTWESSNPSVATVDESGKVTAVAPGEATITVTTEDGSKTATCTVIVHTATTITTQPQSVSVTEGQSATFSVTATGDNLRYQWQINSGNGWSDITGATDASYTIDRTTTAMSGNQYRCIVTGDGGEVTSDAAMLTVNDRPTIPPVTPPSVSEETIDAINDAEPGETVSVAFEDGDTTLDAEVFETLAGQDITLEIALEGGVTWTVNGQDIPADANLDDLDLGVEMDSDGIPVDVINTITGERDTVQMTLAHDGDFGFTMTLTAPLGAENAGYWANLYHYNEATARMDFETAVLIDDDGNAALPLSHASQYAIVIDDHSHATIDLPFSDVSAGDWFYDPVCYVYAGGLMTGVSDTAFAPEATTTRAMIVSMLARLENVTSADSAGFTDVAASDWYATAVNWAASEGIVGGFGDGTFQPNAAITREQMASILYRYAEYKGLDVSARTDLSHYSDQPSVWAEDVMQWAVAEGLLAGVTDDQLQPQGQATRAQVAAILQRFLENVCA